MAGRQAGLENQARFTKRGAEEACLGLGCFAKGRSSTRLESRKPPRWLQTGAPLPAPTPTPPQVHPSLLQQAAAALAQQQQAQHAQQAAAPPNAAALAQLLQAQAQVQAGGGQVNPALLQMLAGLQRVQQQQGGAPLGFPGLPPQ